MNIFLTNGSYCFKVRKVGLSVTCYLERILVQMQLFPLGRLSIFPSQVRNAYRSLYPRNCKGVEILKSGFCYHNVKYFYQHNNTSMEAGENIIFLIM